MVFRIQPHTRLHEWVAEEAGFFRGVHGFMVPAGARRAHPIQAL